MHYHPDSLPNEPVGGRCLAVEDQHGYATQLYVWPVFLALSPYLDANEGTGLQGTNSLGC